MSEPRRRLSAAGGRESPLFFATLVVNAAAILLVLLEDGYLFAFRGSRVVTGLLLLGKEARFDFVDARSGDLEKDLEIQVNGKEVWFYPSGLDRPLEEGDVVEIYLMPLGGG